NHVDLNATVGQQLGKCDAGEPRVVDDERRLDWLRHTRPLQGYFVVEPGMRPTPAEASSEERASRRKSDGFAVLSAKTSIEPSPKLATAQALRYWGEGRPEAGRLAVQRSAEREARHRSRAMDSHWRETMLQLVAARYNRTRAWGSSFSTPRPSTYVTARLCWATASPCSAARRNQAAAIASLSGTP